MALTPEQKERIEKNRLAALERKRARESTTSNCGGTPSSSSQLSQESNASSTASKRAHISNPYNKPSPFKNRPERRTPDPLSQDSMGSIEERRKQFEAEEAQKRERELLPSFPAEPKIREATVNGLSGQQLEVVKLARPPTPICNGQNGSAHDMSGGAQKQQQPGYMVRVTAAAGTGKTTTLLHLAVRCLDLGHDNVTYVTYSKASATDAKERILQMMKIHAGEDDKQEQRITASTLHSCAMKLVAAQEGENGEEVEKKLIDDTALKRLIAKQYEVEIKDYMDPALRWVQEAAVENARVSSPQQESMNRDPPKTYKQKVRSMREQVVTYLYKSFLHFLHSKMTLEQYMNGKTFGRHYFPGECTALVGLEI